MKKSKLVLTAFMLGVVGLAGLPGAAPAEAGVKLEDVKISARWGEGRRPERRGPGRHRGRRHGPRRHHDRWGFHGPRWPGRYGPFPPPPPPPPHWRGRW